MLARDMGKLRIYVLAALVIAMMSVNSINVNKLRAGRSGKLYMTTLEKPPVGKDGVKVNTHCMRVHNHDR